MVRALFLIPILILNSFTPAPDFSALKKSIAQYYHGQEDARKSLSGLKESDLALTRDQFLQIEKAIFDEREYKNEKAGQFEEGLSADEVGIKSGFVCAIPKEYTPAKKWPLIIFTHGGSFEKMGTYETFRNHAKEVLSWFSRQQDWIAVVPVTPEGYGEKSWRKIVFATLAHLRNKYRIDPDRIVLGGGSMGAYGAWETCLFFGDRFSGLLSVAGGYAYEDYAEACLHMPVFMAHGGQDKNTQPENSQTNMDILKKLGYPVEFVKYPKNAHALPYWEIFEKSKPWFEAKPRNPSPKKIIWIAPDVRYFRSAKEEPMRNYWLDVLETDGKSPRVDAEIQDNTVTLTAKSVKKITLFFNDHLLDLDKPVEVIVNGQPVKNEKLSRNAKIMIDRRDDFSARGVLYTASITLEVPPAK